MELGQFKIFARGDKLVKLILFEFIGLNFIFGRTFVVNKLLPSVTSTLFLFDGEFNKGH